jgi:hypothetical protein
MAGTEVILLRSTDTGAPVLTGQAGSLITLLDACLVNGYNSKTITITRSGTTATATCATAHGFAADGVKVQISGANEAAYNGIFLISNVSTYTFDFTVAGSPATPATGTITAKMPALGWTKPFSDVNLAAYRGDAASTGMYMKVNDTTTSHANVRGYETMTDINTGTGLFPTVAQIASGTYWVKSQTTDATARSWIVIGDGYEFFLYVSTHTSYTSRKGFHFGDPKSEMASDPYGCLIIGDIAAVSTYPDTNCYQPCINTNTTSITNITTMLGHYFARAYTQTGSSVAGCKIGPSISFMAQSGSNATPGTNGGIAYPSPVNNGLYIAPIFLVDTLGLRAQMTAMWCPGHTRPLGDSTFLSAEASPIGRRLLSIASIGSSGSLGEVHMDIDGPWR